MSNSDMGNLTALYRAVGKIEGMLSQFLGLQAETTKRITDIETKMESQDTRIDGLEKYRERSLGYVAGVAGLATFIAIVGAWALDKFWKVPL